MRMAELHQLTLPEKLHLIETPIASPAWHFEELKKTDERIRKGSEEILDWPNAKMELRERFAGKENEDTHV